MTVCDLVHCHELLTGDTGLTARPNWQYNFPKCLDGLDIEEIPHAVVDFNAVAPCSE